ncbi:hypothetical protein D3C86_1880230 [compost metagenome]
MHRDYAQNFALVIASPLASARGKLARFGAAGRFRFGGALINVALPDDAATRRVL